jgi:pimeloyl-ACP methyl ester carboxylesterase
MRMSGERQSVAIGGGRVLAFRELGAPDGQPVLYCHGGLMSGLDAAPWDAAARAAGIRIIVPARPGLDGSSPAPGRTTADWADDVRALLDALGIEQVAVLGWSMGGQYALACGALIPDRVTRAVVVAGALPLTDDGVVAELNQMDRRLTHHAQHRPWMAQVELGAMGLVARHAPKAWAKSMTKGAPEGEVTAVAALADPGLARAAGTALSSTHGMVEEYRAWARPWGFAPGDVAVPVTIWQGDADHLVPPRWADALAGQIPDARLARRAGAGHFLAYTHPDELLRALAA